MFIQKKFFNYSVIQKFVEHLHMFRCKVNNTEYDLTDFIGLNKK